MLRTGVILALLMAGGGVSEADQDDQPAPTPPSTPKSGSLSNKLTVAFYDFSSDKAGLDVNLRHTFTSSTAWIGGYRENDGFQQARIGYEYDYRRRRLTFVPSVLAASRGFAGLTLYGEAGERLFAIAGLGRTNLRPYWNLGFDPNDYVQFGVGYRDGAGNTLSAFAIHDNRLNTGQTNTHFYFRRHLPGWRLTIDVVNERGSGDEGLRVSGWSTSVDSDWGRWFIRLAADPHVNYTADRQLRVATGTRF